MSFGEGFLQLIKILNAQRCYELLIILDINE